MVESCLAILKTTCRIQALAIFIMTFEIDLHAVFRVPRALPALACDSRAEPQCPQNKAKRHDILKLSTHYKKIGLFFFCCLFLVGDDDKLVFICPKPFICSHFKYNTFIILLLTISTLTLDKIRNLSGFLFA